MVNVNFELVEHGAMNIEVEGNPPMEKNNHEIESTIQDVGIGAVYNVLEKRIEEDVTSTTDEDDDIHASNDDYKENLDIPIIEKAYEPLHQGSLAILLSIV